MPRHPHHRTSSEAQSTLACLLIFLFLLMSHSITTTNYFELFSSASFPKNAKTVKTWTKVNALISEIKSAIHICPLRAGSTLFIYLWWWVGPVLFIRLPLDSCISTFHANPAVHSFPVVGESVSESGLELTYGDSIDLNKELILLSSFFFFLLRMKL